MSLNFIYRGKKVDFKCSLSTASEMAIVLYFCLCLWNILKSHNLISQLFFVFLSQGDLKNAVVIDEKAEETNVKGIPDFWFTIFRNVDMLSELVQVSFCSEMSNFCCVKWIAAFPISSQSILVERVWHTKSFESLESLKMLERLMVDKHF